MNIIEVKNLTKDFGDIKAVDDISFSVKKGEVFAFLGPNGAGKSTTIKILVTLLRSSKGKIILNGYDPEKDQNKVRQSFGIVFQDPSLDDELTAEENMHFHATLYGISKQEVVENTKRLLEMVELWDRRKSLVKTFSGGMKRRLEIARGLLHQPKIVFLDEPTLGLDPQTRNLLWKYINKLNKENEITIFFTTHYMDEADRIADRIAVIDHGKIIMIDTPINIKKRTNSTTLEEAFLALTGKEIREEEGGSLDKMRMFRRAHK